MTGMLYLGDSVCVNGDMVRLDGDWIGVDDLVLMVTR